MNKAWLNFAVFLVVCAGITGVAGAILGCEPEVKAEEKEYRSANFDVQYLGKATTFGRVYKLKVDSLEYILFYDSNNSTMVKHK